jgi:threonine dehydrogenase-like Zn-dependent dehydrogenase
MQAQAGKPKLAGASQYYIDIPDRGGSFAELYKVLDADMHLAHIPKSVTMEQALMLTDMATTAFEGVRELEVGFGDSVAVLGVGPVGLMGVRAVALKGAARIFAIGSRKICFEVAKEYGATDFIDYHDADFVKKAVEMNGGPVDGVLVAGGTSASITDALGMLKKGGIVSNVAAFYADEKTVIDNAVWGWGYGERTIKAIVCSGGRLAMERLFKLIEYGRLQPEKLITHTFHGMDKATDAVQLFLDHDRSLIKPIVYFD